MIFNIIKIVHIFSVIAWMAGLLYLPRIFVYHADNNIKKETSETFKIKPGVKTNIMHHGQSGNPSNNKCWDHYYIE